MNEHHDDEHLQLINAMLLHPSMMPVKLTANQYYREPFKYAVHGSPLPIWEY